ncbi:MAG: rhomboid family intramembrane serine protease [Kiritimatiellae bacterium]|nr:rhomboid family intramembrane serine protease [Kiritimatiellia bacterium]
MNAPECRVSHVECRPAVADYRLPTAHCRLPTLPRLDLILLAVAIVLVNLPLLTGQGTAVGRFAFLPDLVAAGEWWRVAAHPFAHVSLYHLVLDAGAFLLLYRGFHGVSAGRLLLLCAGAAAGSLACAAMAPDFARSGLCGLSGTAHGLMAASALLSVRAPAQSERRVGWVLLGTVAAKALFEALTGHVLFVSWHPGDIGLPNPFCHLGGVLGGLLCALLMR